MVDWMREVRGLTEARARRLGKPVPLGLRIPPNLGFLKSIGIDVKALAGAGLVDFIGFSNFWQTTWDVPYDELRAELGPEVMFYGVVEDAPNWIQGLAPSLADRSPESFEGNLGNRLMAASPEMQHANAAGKLAMGVHGIEQFNFFCTDQPRIPGLRCDYSALKGTADLAYLRGRSKHYCLSTPPQGRQGMAPVTDLPEQVPAVLPPQWRKEFRLSMCAEPRDRNLQLTVQVVIENRPNPPHLGVSFNGNWPVFKRAETRDLLFPTGPYTQLTSKHLGLNYLLDASQIKEGWNTVLVHNTDKDSDGNAVTIVSLELGLKKSA